MTLFITERQKQLNTMQTAYMSITLGYKKGQCEISHWP